jgi:hypothetical protein
MDTNNSRVLMVGQTAPGALERSYRTALELLGYEVRCFDIVSAVHAHCRFGPLGRLFNNFVSVEPWIRKANRDLVMQALDYKPAYVLTFGYFPIQAGALAQIRASIGAALVHIWPDTLANVNSNLIACLPLFDLVASYSEASLGELQRLGAKQVVWIPLAGDPLMHAPTECKEAEQTLYGADVTFIGGWRPEREAILTELTSFDLKIWGPDWGRRCRGNRALLKKWQGRALYENEFARAVASSKINLNIIDPLNFPAANMRFFEVPVAGGFQVSSSCPELEHEFVDGEHLYYYRDTTDLTALITMLLGNSELRERVAKAGQDRVLSRHTYTHRVSEIFECVAGDGPKHALRAVAAIEQR